MKNIYYEGHIFKCPILIKHIRQESYKGYSPLYIIWSGIEFTKPDLCEGFSTSYLSDKRFESSPNFRYDPFYTFSRLPESYRVLFETLRNICSCIIFSSQGNIEKYNNCFNKAIEGIEECLELNLLKKL